MTLILWRAEPLVRAIIVNYGSAPRPGRGLQGNNNGMQRKRSTARRWRQLGVHHEPERKLQ